MDVEKYIDWYTNRYGKRPSEKLIESFCKSNGIEKKEEEVIFSPPPKVKMLFGKEVEG